MSYLAIDVGTSGCKAAVVDERGGVAASARRSYPLESPQQGYCEIDPIKVREAVFDAVRQVAPHCGGVKGVAFASLGESMAILDESDRVLTNAIVYLDTRNTAQMPELFAVMPREELRRRNRVTPSAMFSLCKLYWLRSAQPDLLERARRIFCMGDYFGYLFSGERAIEPSLMSRTLMLDFEGRTWSREILDRFGLDPALFSPVYASGRRLGRIRPALADELGLPRGMEVILGAHDQCAVTLGGGVLAPGEVMCGQGSAESYNILVDARHQQIAYEGGFDMEAFCTPDLAFCVDGNISHGNCINWFARTFCPELSERLEAEGQSVYAHLDHAMPPDAGKALFFPYLSQVRLGSSELGPMGGFLGVDVSTTREGLYRALLEGLSFESRRALDRVERAGIPLNTLYMAGGCAKSDIFMQMKADVLQRPLHLLREAESGLIGLSMIIACAVGDYASYAEARQQMVHLRGQRTPQRDYAAGYARYLAAMEQLPNS